MRMKKQHSRKLLGGGAALLLVAGAAAAAGAAGADSPQSGSAHGGHDHGDHGHGGAHAKVEKVLLRGTDDQKVGLVTLRQTGDVVVVSGWTTGLTPGFHGFHIHAVGLCEADAPDGPFTTAGGHVTGGAGHTHGDHAGDMPSLLVTQEGWASAKFITDRFTLTDLRDADGSAVMVHAGRDNFANIPDRYSAGGVAGPDAATLATGDSGTRAACGVID